MRDLKALQFICLFVVSLLSTSVISQTINLQYYFQEDVTFDPNVPTPESVLGYQVGEWHVRPEQIAEYMYALASTSKRVWVEEAGRTWEQRPLLLVAFSNEKTIRNLDKVKQQQAADTVTNDSPAVVWMGYSVHGNEASGSNASLLLAYYLAAAQGEAVDKLLSEMVILVDPMLNPDGLARFATWVNARKGQQLIADRVDIEHNEHWPNGRTNHYWFDLNRDWLLAQHPESRARLAAFHQWKPLVLTDFHEMGPNATYFFQPGVPSRQNPITPQKNFDLTSTIAKYHAEALDDIGSTYYSKESFDDFYYGKGSTYPDVNGSIGILFEQASARGHVQESINGDVTFPFAVRNQLTASFSTLKAVNQQAAELKQYQKEFFESAEKEAKKYQAKAYVYHARGDHSRLKWFNEIVKQHQIDVYQLSREITVDKKKFTPADSYIIPTNQKQFRLIRTLFETQTQFKDNTFYDVSSWTLALSFNLEFAALDSGDYSSRLIGKKGHYTHTLPLPVIEKDTVALAFEWDDYASMVLANRLLKQGVRLNVATKSTKLMTSTGAKVFEQGTIFLPVGLQDYSVNELNQLLTDVGADLSLPIHTIASGLALSGVDLGSPSMRPLREPKPLMVVEGNVSSYDAGEVWHLLDHRLEIPLVKVSVDAIGRIDLSRYTHLIMVNGNYTFNEDTNEKIEAWIKKGGQLVANRGAGRWLSKQKWSPIEKVEAETELNERLRYEQREDFRAKNVIGGAIFQIDLDTSHPLAFGVNVEQLPVFRRGADTYKVVNEPFAVVGQYTQSPLISGYASESNIESIAETPAIVAVRKDKGGVIYFADNMNFRAFWLGTSKLFANSLFFSHAYQSSAK